MSQHDLSIANQSAPLFRSDLNNALAALGSLQSGPTAPPGLPYNSMFWYDTAEDTLKIGNEAGDAWYPVGYVDNSAGSFNIIDGTTVSTTAGVAVGSLSAQSEATWIAGVSTTESLVSPEKIKAVVDANVPVTGWVLFQDYWDSVRDGAINSVTSYPFEDGYDYRLVFVASTSSGSDFLFSLQGATDDLYRSVQLPTGTSGIFEIGLSRVNSLEKPVSGIPSGFNMVTSQKVKAFRMNAISGSMATGKVIIQRIKSSYV